MLTAAIVKLRRHLIVFLIENILPQYND